MMDLEDEKFEVLKTVLGRLFDVNAGFPVDDATKGILTGLQAMGWTLSYDREYTNVNVARMVAHAQAKHPTPPPFVPPQPPERLQ